jgi:hypothetical protein
LKLHIVKTTRFPQWLKWAGPLFTLWLLLVGTLAYISKTLPEPVPMCLFKWITGLPCPTCGLTRAGLHLLSADLAGAFMYNPLCFAAILAAVGALLSRIISGRQLRISASPKEKKIIVTLLITALSLNWLFVITFVG